MSVGQGPALPLPYREIVRALNVTYRGTRWHNRRLAEPDCRLTATVREGAIRIDLFQARGLVIVMPRPTDWSDFHSFSANACLAKCAAIQAAVYKISERLHQDDVPRHHHLALIGFSQAGYVAMKLGAALMERREAFADNLSITTFNCAPLDARSGEMEAALAGKTTHYRTVIGGSPTNALGYRVGDYVTLLGPLPGTTFEVEMEDRGAAVRGGPSSLSYLGLHADPYLIPEDAAQWRLKDISAQARSNPGLAISTAVAAAWDESWSCRGEFLALLGRAALYDARRPSRQLDPGIIAQLENLAAFAQYKSGFGWRLVRHAAQSASRHPRAGFVWRGCEIVLGNVLKTAGTIIGAWPSPSRVAR